tara:strand:+ start:180947 stop:181306 length:360 start_codon:yes stop_codon:yes gene_type:complete
METVIYNGNVYEIGKFYLFSNDDKYFEFNSLHTINDPVKKYPFITDSNGAFKRIKEIPTGIDLGTITPALIAGQAYMFNYQGVTTQGIYKKNKFYVWDGWHSCSNCKNIREMIVGDSNQ